MGANYLDEDGQFKPIVMGSYGIGSGRLLGLCRGGTQRRTWADHAHHYRPLPGLPDLLARQKDRHLAMAEKLYEELQAAGVEVLFDDRDERPGVKFNDADLIGIPLRLMVGERALKKADWSSSAATARNAS